MSTNLHAMIRYRILDTCFRERRHNKSWEELAQACGDALREYQSSDTKDPSRRTIFGDMDTMKSGKLGYEAPIVHSRKLGYHYNDPDFSISKQPLTAEDRTNLADALFILKQFRGFSHLEGMDGVITRLEHGILGEASPFKEALQMDQARQFKGLKWIDSLLQAVRAEQRVRLVYRPFNFPDAYSTEVSPYLLKEYNNRWFLAGYDHGNDRIQNYGLERIEDLTRLETANFTCPVNLREHYRQVVGVTVRADRELERVVFRAIQEQAFYINTKPIHHSQRVLSVAPESTTFAIDVIPNFELESILLSYGERIEVLEPESLRLQMKERYEQAARLYAECSE